MFLLFVGGCIRLGSNTGLFDTRGKDAWCFVVMLCMALQLLVFYCWWSINSIGAASSGVPNIAA
jgi:hypothetical protein